MKINLLSLEAFLRNTKSDILHVDVEPDGQGGGGPGGLAHDHVLGLHPDRGERDMARGYRDWIEEVADLRPSRHKDPVGDVVAAADRLRDQAFVEQGRVLTCPQGEGVGIEAVRAEPNGVRLCWS